jgi:hypothetical protein
VPVSRCPCFAFKSVCQIDRPEYSTADRRSQCKPQTFRAGVADRAWADCLRYCFHQSTDGTVFSIYDLSANDAASADCASGLLATMMWLLRKQLRPEWEMLGTANRAQVLIMVKEVQDKRRPHRWK